MDRLTLTPREQVALELMAHGHGEQQAAQYMGISVYTVKKHWQSVRIKLGAKHNHGAVGAAFRKGILE